MWIANLERRLGALPDGRPVFDRVDSHLDGHPEVRGYLEEAFARIGSPTRLWAGVVDLGRQLGTSSCVEVAPDEPVLYAWRHGRRGCSRFVRGREPVACTTVKLVLYPEAERAVLVTAFIGGDVAPEPWSSGAASSDAEHLAAVRFWECHALIWDETLVDQSRGVLPEAAEFWERAEVKPGHEGSAQV